MRKFIVASGAALGSMVIGVVNSIVVVRGFADELAAEFFQVTSLAILVGVVGEAGLGNYSVHDSARITESSDVQSYVNDALRESALRGAVAGAAALVVGRLVFGFSLAACISGALATWGIVVAIVGQSLLRGTGRDLAASFGGPVGATMLAGCVLAAGLIVGGVDPVHLGAGGYAITGAISFGMLWRPITGRRRGRPDELSVRRTIGVGISNICNAAGRQLDVWIAGVFLAGAAFNSYALSAKIAASVGVVSYAAVQATAADTHRWVHGDEEVGDSIRNVHAIGLGVVVLFGVGCVAVAPQAGRFVFGDDIQLSRGILVVLLLGYALAAVSGPTMLALVAADRADIVLRSSVIALAGALAAAGSVALAGGRASASAAFVLGWLGLVSVVSGVKAERALGIRTLVSSLPHRPQRVH